MEVEKDLPKLVKKLSKEEPKYTGKEIFDDFYQLDEDSVDDISNIQQAKNKKEETIQNLTKIVTEKGEGWNEQVNEIIGGADPEIQNELWNAVLKILKGGK